jgi:hypothetical protein
VNFAAIQTIIATLLTVILVICIFCQTSVFINIWNHFFGKDLPSEELEETEESEEPQELEKPVPTVQWSDDIKNQKSVIRVTLGMKIKTIRNKIIEAYKDLNKKG